MHRTMSESTRSQTAESILRDALERAYNALARLLRQFRETWGYREG